jgi:hypothetical protein
MMGDLFIWISRWEEFQHYAPERDRPPAWIKEYTKQLDDDRYRDLTQHQRGLLASLRLAFSKARADMKLDRGKLSARIGATVYQRDLDALNHAGFIELISREVLDQRLDHLYRSSSPRARPLARREVEKDREEEALPREVYEGQLLASSLTDDSAREANTDLDDADDDIPWDTPSNGAITHELERIAKALIGTDNTTIIALAQAAGDLPIGYIARVRESVEANPGVGVGWAINALRSEKAENEKGAA